MIIACGIGATVGVTAREIILLRNSCDARIFVRGELAVRKWVDVDDALFWFPIHGGVRKLSWVRC